MRLARDLEPDDCAVHIVHASAEALMNRSSISGGQMKGRRDIVGRIDIPRSADREFLHGMATSSFRNEPSYRSPYDPILMAKDGGTQLSVPLPRDDEHHHRYESRQYDDGSRERSIEPHVATRLAGKRNSDDAVQDGRSNRHTGWTDRCVPCRVSVRCHVKHD
jgi:hypothetical protein